MRLGQAKIMNDLSNRDRTCSMEIKHKYSRALFLIILLAFPRKEDEALLTGYLQCVLGISSVHKKEHSPDIK